MKIKLNYGVCIWTHILKNTLNNWNEFRGKEKKNDERLMRWHIRKIFGKLDLFNFKKMRENFQIHTINQNKNTIIALHTH